MANRHLFELVSRLKGEVFIESENLVKSLLMVHNCFVTKVLDVYWVDLLLVPQAKTQALLFVLDHETNLCHRSFLRQLQQLDPTIAVN